uniref:Uncharacterized protein n=1 Tax=viral metagenome TaxID=1070528 RepID=A0A6C0CPL5_9ZZZZ
MFCFYRENQEEIMQTPEYKVIVVGESMTGKSTFVHNMFYNRKRRGNPRCTIGVDVVAVDFHGPGEKKRANFWDCAGNPLFAGLGESYWEGATHALIFGVSHRTQYRYYLNRLPEIVRRKVILDYDQDNNNIQELKQEIYDFLE